MKQINILSNFNNKIEIKKPWGKEVIWSDSEKYLGKLLYINSYSKLSLQYHIAKEETIYVMEGTLFLHIEGETILLKVGDSYKIVSKEKHRFEAREGNVVLIEVSTYHPKDVVRLEDMYGRS